MTLAIPGEVVTYKNREFQVVSIWDQPMIKLRDEQGNETSVVLARFIADMMRSTEREPE